MARHKQTAVSSKFDNDPKSSVVGEAVAATRTLDAFSNPAARTGYGELNLINATEYPLTRMTQDWQLLTSLYRSSWIVQRVCSIIPEDALVDMHIEAQDLSNNEIERLDFAIKKTRIRRRLIDSLKWARLYGGAAAIVLVEGEDEDMMKPLRPDKLLPGSFRGLYVVDRWSGIYPSTELVTNPDNVDFGLPRYYEVRDESGIMKYRVHHSRVLRFVGCDVPYWEQIAEQQWGTSVIEGMYDDLVRRDNVTHNIANLTFKACLSVYEIDALDQIFASSSAVAQKRMYSMIQAMTILESNLGVKLVNKGDAVQQLQYQFSGLPEVLDGAMMDCAGATSIPVTRLFGRSPAGQNSTGESDERMYRGVLEQQRAVHIIPVLEKLAPIVCQSAIGRIPDGAEFKLPPLYEMSQTEKMDIVDKQSGYLERLFQAGVIPADVLLNGVRNAQVDVGITTTILDENIEAMRGKYLKDLNAPADPFGGPFQGQQQQPEQEPEPEQNEEQQEPQEENKGKAPARPKSKEASPATESDKPKPPKMAIGK